MAKALMHYPKQSNKTVLQQMPFQTDIVSLVDLVGKDSWKLLQIWNEDRGFLKANLKPWQQNSDYIRPTAHDFVKNLNFVNDASEHAFGLLTVTVFNMRKATRSRKQQGYLK